MARKPSPLNKAKAIVGAQYAPIDHALGVAQKQSAAQQQALNAARLALVQQLQQGVAPAGQVYDQAVQQQQGLAQSGAKLLSDANPNQGIQQGLQSIGAPPEQQAQLASSLQSLFPGAGSVLNVQEGTVPGASLLAQKAATQGYLAGLPTVAVLSGEQSLRGLLASAANTRNKLLEQRLQVGGQLPALAQSLAQQGVENSQADRSFNEQVRQYQQTQAFNARQAELERIAQQQLTPYQRASLKLDQRKLNADIAASKLTTANGGLTAYQDASLKERKREFNARQGTGSSSVARSTTKPTPGQIRDYAELAYYGKQPNQKSVIQPDGSRKIVNEGGVAAIGYQKALFRLMHTYGLKLSQAQSVLNDYYAPGEDGRPLVDYQRRKALGVTDTGRPLKKRKKRG